MSRGWAEYMRDLALRDRERIERERAEAAAVQELRRGPRGVPRPSVEERASEEEGPEPGHS